MRDPVLRNLPSLRHDPGAPWPFPLLCLLWRLGLGGQWLTAPPAPSPEELFAITTERLTQVNGAAPSPCALPSLSPVLFRALSRSPLTQLSIGSPLHQAALYAAALLLCLGAPGATNGRTRPGPLGWWKALAARLPPGTPRVWVPRPAPTWDPATWQLIEVFESAWEADGITCLGRERPVLFRLAGTRRMAARFGWPRKRALACGRTAFRLWRHWFVTQERSRVARIEGWPLPPAIRRVAGSPILLYRQTRAAYRREEPAPVLAVLPPPLRTALERVAAASVDSLRPPVTAAWPLPGLEGLAAILTLSPLGILAGQLGAPAETVHAAAARTAEYLVRALSAPWPWKPRPVVRGPRRARQEFIRRHAFRA